MRNHRSAWLGRIAVAMMASACAGSALAQAPGKLDGHWEGNIEVPGAPLAIAIDVFAAPGEKWDGTIAIAAQNVKGLPLTDVSLKGTAVEFGLKGVPGDPKFTGTLSPDGKVISGSTPITKDFEGTWEGALDVGGKTLRLVLTLTNADGRGAASIVSVDQGGVQIPAASVQQNASHLNLDVRTIAASYEGDLKDGQIDGTWTQGPNSLPLVFKRSAAPQK
jgi:hypothetical protein